MSANSDTITIFDRINLANCAKERAITYLLNETRFISEYKTARLWIKYRCVISPNHSYVDDF